MSVRALLFSQFGVVSILAALHIYAMTHFYYWIYPWFDIPAHFLGGLWAGLFAAWVLALQRKPPMLVACIGAALFLGIAWEVFETVIGLMRFPADILDTIKDVSVDVIGGLAGAILARRIDEK